MKLSVALYAGVIAFTMIVGNSVAEPLSNSQNDLVFQIGTFDRSSMEFSQEKPDHPVLFVVGESDPAKDWYAAQPAEGSKPPASVPEIRDPAAPREIRFSLSQNPAPAYRLRLALLIEDLSVPALSVEINGKRGRFYLHPKLDTGMGDLYDAYHPSYSHDDVSFVFPGKYLHAGVNTISLQAVEDHAPPDAGMNYDAIALERVPEDQLPRASTAEIFPTIFYKRGAKGSSLEEEVDIILRHGQSGKPGSEVNLSIAGKHYQQAVGDTTGQDFGEEKVVFSVEEFVPGSRSQLSWNIDGHDRHLAQPIDPARKWTLFVVPHIHLDVGYSDYQAKIAAIQSRAMDEAMDMTVQHPDFRFSVDGSWNLEQYLKTRSPVEQRRVIDAIQKKSLYIPAQYANMLTGFASTETLIHSLYASAEFAEEHGTPFNYANITDVPSFTWSYPSILAAAGIHELLSGSDNLRAPVLLQGHLNEHSPMWWEGPDGAKVLFWYSRMYTQVELLFGLPPETGAGRDTLPLFLQQYDHPDYRANATILFGTQVENTDLFPQQAELAGQWNAIYAYPHLQYSGVHDALDNIKRQFGDAIPTIRGDGGPYWEDGIASDAEYAAIERQNEARGPSAEKLATLSSLVNPRLAADKTTLARMWNNMVLMDEHTFTSFNSVSQPSSEEAASQIAVKNLFATNAKANADWLVRNSMASIADSISVAHGNLIVFNTLNWKRNGPVIFDLSNEDEIVDQSNGEVIPFEIVQKGEGFRRVRFVAHDVPPVGYKVFSLRHAAKTDRPMESETDANTNATLESPYYRVELDPSTGAVRSVYDKQLGRELVDTQSPYRFGEYLYVSGGDHEPNRLLQYSSVTPVPELQIHPAHNGKLLTIFHTVEGWGARMESEDTNTPSIITEIRLFDHEKKIEFVEDLDKKEVKTKEAVYLAFPFAIEHADFHYEIQNGVVDPAKNMYPGAGHEWFSVQHWISAEQEGLSAALMPLDASLVTLGDIDRGVWPQEFGDRPGTIFSYLMNNYWWTNYRAGQGGHFHFRYVITSSSSTDSAKLSRAGWEEMTPLESDEVTSQDKETNPPRTLDGKQVSFLNASDPNVVLEAWKPAEDGNGTILRLLDLGGATRSITIQTPLWSLQEAWQTDAVERNLKRLPLADPHGVEFTIHPNEILTLRLVTPSR